MPKLLFPEEGKGGLACGVEVGILHNGTEDLHHTRAGLRMTALLCLVSLLFTVQHRLQCGESDRTYLILLAQMI